MHNEAELLKNIANKCLAHVDEVIDSNHVTKLKGGSEVDAATAVDVSVEGLIVAAIHEGFPGDNILAEEGYSDTSIGADRIWVIDPICGTTNLSRGITTYCTNIALVENGDIVAACVVNYSEKEVIWSVGDGVYDGSGKRLSWVKRGSGVLCYVDLGCLHAANEAQLREFNSIVTTLAGIKGWMLGSFNTSLGNMYVATGAIDVAVNYIFKPWDVCANVFLVRQLGGQAVDYNGNDWKIGDNRLILCMDKDLLDVVVDVTKLS